MALHPEARRFLDALAAQGTPPGQDEISPAEMRAGFAAAWRRTGPFTPVGEVYDRTIPGPAGELPVRVFVPEGDGPFPALVWLHGGGWVIGAPDDNEPACRTLCREVPAVVVSVDYRLAPEHRFPAAAEDAYAAARWAAAGGRLSEPEGRGAAWTEERREPATGATREGGAQERPAGERASTAGGGAIRAGAVAVGGESAGGNLAAACALLARDRGGPPIALQFLVSPVLGRPDDGRGSYAEFADGYFQSADSMEFFFRQYPRDEADLKNPYLLPLAAGDLTGLPPALVMTAEYEVLRDEGEEYARRLRAAGVPAELVRYDGQIHGFFGLLDDHLSIAARAQRHAAAVLRAAFTANGEA